MREWRNANDSNHCHDCSVLLPKPKAQARQDTAAHVSLSVSTMSNSYPKVLSCQVKPHQPAGWPGNIISASKGSVLIPHKCQLEQAKPAGQMCAPRLLTNPRCERCVYGPRSLVSKGFLTKKSFFFIFSLTLSVVVPKGIYPLLAVVARVLPQFDTAEQMPSACAT